MFLKSFSAASENRPAQVTAEAADEDAYELMPQPGYGGFETFGRAGLDIGGLHRDQQWVGAWGGRC